MGKVQKMFKAIFVDTCGWIALNNKRDTFFDKAQRINKELLTKSYRYITTNFVLDETYTALLDKANHFITVNFGESIRKANTVDVIYITKDIEDRSWNLFKRYSDKDFSFTDCTSFIIIQDLIRHMGQKFERKIFTNDKHFKQMGYELLL